MAFPPGRKLPEFDTTVPNESRMYDYYLGGKDNFAADREAAELALELAPELQVMAREARGFLRRAVRYLAATGIRQFIDLGAGLPTQGNVHEIAQAVSPDCRVVYVDHDPVVCTYARALLARDPLTAVIQADMRDSKLVIGHPELRRLIDLNQPVALLFFAVLFTIPDDEEAAQVVTRLGNLVPPGSRLAISHPVCDLRPDVTARLAYLYQQQTNVIPGRPRDNVRSKAEVERFFAGWDLIKPGVVYLPEWRPDEETTQDPGLIWCVGGIARKT